MTSQDVARILSEPIKINQQTLKSRLVMGPMAVNFASPDGAPTEETIAYFERRARGGVGMIIVGGIAATTRETPEMTGMSGLHFNVDTFIPDLKRIADAVHAHGVPIIAEILPSLGRMARPPTGGRLRPGLLAMLVLLQATAAAAAPPDAAGLTKRNRQLIVAFADLFYGQKKVREAFETYVSPDYVQHNPGIADGRDAAIAALAPMFASPDRSFTIRRILVDGDLAAIHVQVAAPTPPGTRGAAVVDLYRIENGRIVEHWDVIQLIPLSAANPHPGF